MVPDLESWPWYVGEAVICDYCEEADEDDDGYVFEEILAVGSFNISLYQGKSKKKPCKR